MLIRNRELNLKSDFYIMGILNVTPDSFSDGGKHNDRNSAVDIALKMVEDGADIIDIGGESTRPGFTYVSEQEEIDRVIPVVRGIRERNNDILISVDTTKASVAEKAILAGADIINDVSGFLFDEKMAEIAAKYNAPSILMHDSGYFVNDEAGTDKYIDRIVKELNILCNKAIDKGVSKNLIIVDPGVGFGKTVEENLTIIRDLQTVCRMDYPVLLGCSRKSVIGLSLDLSVGERMEGTLTTSIYGAMMGAGILRVHDVKENVRAVNMLKSIIRLDKNPCK